MLVRIRFPELLEKSGLSPYQVSKLSAGAISMSTAYRLNRSKGKVHTFDADLLDALCDIFGVEPGELLERGPKKRRGR